MGNIMVFFIRRPCKNLVSYKYIVNTDLIGTTEIFWSLEFWLIESL